MRKYSMERASANEFGGAVHIGEDLELVGDAQIVPIRREAVGDDAFAHLLLAEGLDHLVLIRLRAYPLIALDGHLVCLHAAGATNGAGVPSFQSFPLLRAYPKLLWGCGSPNVERNFCDEPDVRFPQTSCSHRHSG
jgi:hypothetical protein